MRIGDRVTYDGRLYAVRGLDPMGVPGRRADLEDVETKERRRVPVAELEPEGAGERPEIDPEGRWLH